MEVHGSSAPCLRLQRRSQQASPLRSKPSRWASLPLVQALREPKLHPARPSQQLDCCPGLLQAAGGQHASVQLVTMHGAPIPLVDCARGLLCLTASCLRALQRLQELAQESPGAPGVLRLLVEGGGCSGYSYHFSLEDAAKPDDKCGLPSRCLNVIWF